MSGLVGSVEAVLKLNISNFQTEINSAIKSINELSNAAKSVSNSTEAVSKLATSFGELGNAASKSSEQIKKIETSIKQVGDSFKGTNSNLNTMYESLNRISNSGFSPQITQGVRLLDEALTGVNTKLNTVAKETEVTKQSFNSMSNMTNGFRLLDEAIAGTNTNLTSLHERIRLVNEFGFSPQITQGIKLLDDAVTGVNSKLNATLRETQATSQGYASLGQSASSTKASTDSLSSSTSKASSEMSKANSSAKLLSGTMSALKTAVSFTASMFAFQLADGLIQSARAAISNKSEMESYFDVMGMTKGQVSDFNNTLEETIGKFQKVSKYNLGETVASLGVEFELTNEEMKKTADVVAMIQNEYVRAGRSSEEATLAVKDILQGEFVRLSRETGVGKGELIENGWSGDTKDIQTLLDALQKIGENRNWDTFAAKATSLNDILTILQNRFSTWAADMTSAVTPAVTTAFNELVVIFESLGSTFGNVYNTVIAPLGSFLKSIHADVIAFAGALTIAGMALVNYRTGASMLQMLQMGFKDSLIATVFGLEAETTATYGSLTAITAKITGYEAETVAAIGSRNAIIGKILGINQEALAHYNLRGALVQNLLAEEVMTAAKEQSAVAIAGKFTALETEAIAQMSTTEAIWATIFALDAEAVANNGVIATLAAKAVEHSFLTRVINAETIATSGATTATLALSAAFLASPVGLFITGLVAVGAALASCVILPAMEAADKMKAYNEAVQDGDNLIKNYEASLQGFKDEEQRIRDELSQTAYGTDDYNKKLAELEEASENTAEAQDTLSEAIRQVKKAQGMDDWETQNETETAIKTQKNLKDLMRNQGYSDDAINSVNTMNSSLEYGNQIKYRAQQVWNKQADNFLKNEQTMNDALEKNNVPLEERKGWVDDLGSAYQDLQIASKRANESDDWMERLSGQWDAGWAQMKIDWINFWADPAGNLEKGVGMFSDWVDSNLNQPIVDWANGVGQWVSDGLSGIWGNISSAFSGAGQWISDGLSGIWGGLSGIWEGLTSAVGGGVEFISNWVNDNIVQPFSDEISAFMENPLAYILINGFNIASLLDNLLGGATDFTGIWLWLSENVIIPLSQAWSQFTADPLGYIQSVVMDIGQLLSGLLGSSIESIMTWVDTNLVQPFVQGLMSLPQNVWNILTTVIGNIVSWGSQLLSHAIQAGANFVNGVITHVSQLPGQVWTWLVNVVSKIVSAGAQWVSNARTKAQEVISKVIEKISELPGKIYDEFMKIPGKIRQAASDAVKAAGDFATGILNNVLDTLGIHSPGFIQKKVVAEFYDTADRVAESAPYAGKAAGMFGENIVDSFSNNDFESAFNLDYLAEAVSTFAGTTVPEAISSGVSSIYENSAMVGQAMVDGIQPSMDYVGGLIQSNIQQQMNDVALASDAVQFTGLDPAANQAALNQYAVDSQTATNISVTTTGETAAAFNSLTGSVSTAMTTIGTQMQSTYSNMGTTQTAQLNNMKNTNSTAFKSIETTTTNSLNSMRSSTQNVTGQMVNAWYNMKDSIVAAASQLQSQTSSHFNQISSVVGGFYRKLQNPSNWGAGDASAPKRYSNRTRYNRAKSSVNNVFRNVTSVPHSTFGSSKHGAGIPTISSNNHGAGGRDSYSGLREEMPLRRLLNIVCPSGSNCLGTFSSEELSQKVNVEEFLSQFPGGFGWGDWYPSHLNKIKNTSREWSMKGPQIMGYIDTGSSFKVKDFENGYPKITFESFKKMAEALFSAIPYDFYYDSDKCGSWQAALRSGSVNCSDGADALIALAHTCGLSAHKVHGHWGSYGHFWAVVNGQKMDTTGWQQRRTWTPSASAGGPVRSHASPVGNEVNVTVDMKGATIYGVDDLEDKINNGVQEGLQKAINVSSITGL